MMTIQNFFREPERLAKTTKYGAPILEGAVARAVKFIFIRFLFCHSTHAILTTKCIITRSIHLFVACSVRYLMGQAYKRFEL